MKKIIRALLWISVLALFLTWTQPLPAEQKNIPETHNTDTLPQEVEAVLGYLLGLVDQKGAGFDGRQVVPLINYAIQGNLDPDNIRPAPRSSGKGVCLKTQVMAPLKRILRYAYNPSIPNFVVYPSVLRLSGWYPDSEIMARNARLWDEMKYLAKPLLLRGREFEVNTPDSFSGAYYRYDLNRLIGLMKHKKGQVLISVSKMIKKSRVGRKAVIIDDNNWNYFYSGINGLNLKIIGGMDTYMYDSESVMIYYQEDAAIPHTTVLLFKWLKAGWAGINVVQPKHIYEGCTRFAQGLKTVMESDTLPPSDVFIELVNYIKTLSDAEINSKIREYSANFERIAKKHKDMAKPDFARIIADGGYAGVLNRQERLALLILEGLKRHIGKPTLVTFEFPSLPKETVTDSGPALAPDKLEALKPGVISSDKKS